MDQKTIQELSAGGRHQECLQACQQILQSEPENSLPWKYAGKSLLSLRQFEKAQQCLLKAHQLDGSDPEIVKDIGNLFLNIGNKDTAVGWYKKALEINNNYAPAINNLANIKRQSGNTLEAVELYKRVIQADPKLIQGYVGAAASFLELGDLDQAESFAAQALAINERTPGVNEICGIVLQNKNKSNEAIKCYQKELEVNPQASNSLLNLGLLHLQKGQTATGVESLSKASAIAPSEQCSLLLAQAYQNLGQLQAAIIEYKKLNINQSKNKMIPFNLGLCLLNTGNNIDAIEAFKTAIQLDDSFIPAWGNLGNSLKREGRLKEAIQATQKVLDLDPDNPTAHMNLGSIHKELGQLDQALASTLQSLELKPDNPTAHMNLGGIYKELGQLDQALASTLQSLELKTDNPDALINLGGIYKDLGQLDQALASTLQSLELKPDNPDALINLGGIYKELGQFDQALASTLQSLELKPNNPDALINLGGIYKELGQLDQALASTLQSLELKPDNPTAHMNLGGIYKNLGQLDQALASTLQSLELKTDNPDALINLGGIYKELGQFDQALASTLQSLELKPDNPTAHMNLGSIHKDLGQLDQALASTLQSLELKPDNPTAHMNLGSIHKDLGQLDQALASTLQSLELKTDNPDAHMNLGQIYGIKNKKEQSLKHYVLSAELLYSHSKGSSITSMISSLPILIQLGKIKEAKEKITKIPQLLSNVTKSIANYNATNKKNDQAYFRYLKALLPEIPLSTNKDIPESIHIGDSHCLAFANQIISMNCVNSQIKPSLVKGAKAWHLGNQKINNFKTCFQNAIKAGLDHYELILLSFGEIDCRQDEGVLKYCRKNNARIEDVCQSTARMYIHWIASKLPNHQRKLIILGIPAPQKIKPADSTNSDEMNSRRLSVIRSFNKSLSEECSELMITFADVLQLTGDADGFNNGYWMIDNIHLKPKAIQEIISHYLIRHPDQ